MFSSFFVVFVAFGASVFADVDCERTNFMFPGRDELPAREADDM